MGLQTSVIQFFIRKNLQKGIKGAATSVVALIVPLLVKHAGVELTTEQQIALTAAIAGAIVSGTNFLKQKFPDTLGWL